MTTISPHLPNILTIFRFFLAAAALWLLAMPTFLAQFLAGIFFTLAVITDYYDGYFARKYQLISVFGKIADPIADKVLMLGMYIMFSVLGLFSMWWVIAIAIREIGITILRLFFLAKGCVVAAERMGKIKVGFQVGSIYAGWLVVLFQYAGEGTWGAMVLSVLQVILYVGLVLAVFFTVYSGLIFLIKNNANIAELGVAEFLGTVCYVGKMPKMPGTCGSLVALPLFMLVHHDPYIFAVSFAAICILGTWAAHMCAVKRGTEDPQHVVIDEVAGMFLTLMCVPYSWYTMLIGFVLFRFFDMVKPWPIRKLEPIPYGFGIMLDDIAAGVLANAVLQVIVRVM